MSSHSSYYYKFSNGQTNMNKNTYKYTYVTHPSNLPLELNGKSKKRSTELKKEEFNGDRGNINEDSRSLLARKIANNIHDLGHLKSILPAQCEKKQSRPNSIKTFKQNKQNIKSSGVQYLMHKTEILKPTTHPEKMHLSQYLPPDLKRPQKKHFDKENIESIGTNNKVIKNHKETVDIRLANDIYSNIYRVEKETGPSKKLQHANLFKNGQQLGLEVNAHRRVSDNKLIQMMGNQAMNNKQGGLRQRRQDWRISNINFF